MTLDYGIIGNRQTAALISSKGSIDWCCFPRFDSPSVFAKLLDNHKGGSFEIIPTSRYVAEQTYVKNTNVLSTSFKSRRGEFEVLDFFPCYVGRQKKFKSFQEIHRIINVRKGNPKVKFKFDPRFDYARDKPDLSVKNGTIVAEGEKEKLFLNTDLGPESIMERKPIGLEGEAFFILSHDDVFHTRLAESKRLLERTIGFWREVIKKTTLPSKYKGHVIRSVLVLELLRYEESGAIIAAATTSLPEIIGEERNWDYRYCWLRDAALTVDALTKVCHFDEVREFAKWLVGCCKILQTVRGVGGETELSEKILKHLDGYKKSRPIRIGNDAYKQTQNDVHGEVLESFYKFFVEYEYAREMTPKQWKIMVEWVNAAAKLWKKKDQGIWEFREKKGHYTFSKLLCWVALDRGAKLALKCGDSQRAEKWKKIAEEIREDILQNGWNEKVKAFTQKYGSDDLDASLLLVPHFGFLPPKHPKVLSTIDEIDEKLREGCFVYRYKAEDDFGKPKNAFIPCSLWLVEAMYLAGRKKLARKLFEDLLNYSNHLGLFSEDIDPYTKELLGNFPQAYTHMALVNAAVMLSESSVKKPKCEIKLG
jgi:GH15 family glucan-1,4-alpha-glucosidase